MFLRSSSLNKAGQAILSSSIQLHLYLTEYSLLIVDLPDPENPVTNKIFILPVSQSDNGAPNTVSFSLNKNDSSLEIQHFSLKIRVLLIIVSKIP